MTAFPVGEQTHPAVLPQRRALEPVAADTPGSRDETGHERATRPGGAAVGEHGRGEIVRTSPFGARRHPDAAVTGAEEGVSAARESSNQTADQSPVAGAQLVAVLDARGRPLMPCHPARARKLLSAGRAVVARQVPFAIRLKTRTLEGSEVAGLAVRIDPGSTATGIAVTSDTELMEPVAGETHTARSGLFALELNHRSSQIRHAMARRANCRRRRRSANLRYRAPRFSNRKRPEGWLAPSLQHRVDTTVSQVQRLMKLMPIVEIHVERVSFDTHAMSLGRDRLDGPEYQQGALAGYEVRQYLLEKWGRACAYCGAIGVPLQVEHIRPKARGGSDRVSNLTLACEPCNQAKSAKPVEEFLAGKPVLLTRILAQAKAPLRDAAAMNSTRWKLWNALQSLELPVHAWSGGRTKYNRITQGLTKSHTLDALAVGEIPVGARIVRHPGIVLVVTATGRGSYARTRTDAYGFPRLRLTRIKQHFGFQTGDLVRAAIPRGKYAGTWTGRVAVRATGKFTIRAGNALAKNILHRHLRLLQRGDGYAYSVRQEAVP
ncbi:RNA-guided endonuclease IscB [Streptomyces flaveus]|uniref:RNA-guided endonuclease IscB n=1 Tax=Streptomyces flaveus TaxID=66370 RepID=UPI003328CAD9